MKNYYISKDTWNMSTNCNYRYYLDSDFNKHTIKMNFETNRKIWTVFENMHITVMFLKSFFQRYIMKYSWMKWDAGLDLFQNNPGVGGEYREKKVGHECITHW